MGLLNRPYDGALSKRLSRPLRESRCSEVQTASRDNQTWNVISERMCLKKVMCGSNLFWLFADSRKISWGFFDFRGGKAEDLEPEELVVPEPVGHADESPDFLVESLGGGVVHAPGLTVREDAPEVAALPAVVLRGGDAEQDGAEPVRKRAGYPHALPVGRDLHRPGDSSPASLCRGRGRSASNPLRCRGAGLPTRARTPGPRISTQAKPFALRRPPVKPKKSSLTARKCLPACFDRIRPTTAFSPAR